MSVRIFKSGNHSVKEMSDSKGGGGHRQFTKGAPMVKRLVQRAMRKRATRFIPSFIRRALKPMVTRATGFDPRLTQLRIGEARPDDCFIASYPRSGNTWLRFILASLLAPSEEISFRNIDRFIPDPGRTPLDVEKMASPRLIKTHWPYFDLFPRCVYLVRDPRDVFISYYHYACINGWFAGDLEGFSLFRSAYGGWKEHVSRGLEHAAEHPDNVLLLKYEEILSRPLAEIRRLDLFLGLNSSDKEIESAIKKTSFSSLKAKEKIHGTEHRGAAGFFREGTSGQWRNKLSAAQIQRMTLEYRPLLERLGYELV